jgi:hypothetical protein
VKSFSGDDLRLLIENTSQRTIVLQMLQRTGTNGFFGSVWTAAEVYRRLELMRVFMMVKVML